MDFDMMGCIRTCVILIAAFELTCSGMYINISFRGGGYEANFIRSVPFPNFSALSKHKLTIDYQVYIWQMSPQLGCGCTCQI